MSFPIIDDVEFEQQEKRLKVIMPAHRQQAYFALYSILLVAWIGVTIWMLGLLFGTSLQGLTTMFVVVWVIILIIWAYVWYRLGRMVWYWWQYFTATREVLFVDQEILIVRRPLSILGVTDAYDMQHVNPFYYSEKYDAIAFDYGSREGHFGQSLPRPDAEQVIEVLNSRFFPQSPEPPQDVMAFE
ncbi:MAG TPA: hypothetical protein VK879_07045 [Candidatus Sulfomarinibacteraceae bacterium]|nr:hypothetical protein [Candidatus Sulfomarinibacteraceae bacterium]